MRLLILAAALPAMLGVTVPDTRIAVTLPAAVVPDAAGRLLLFATPVTADTTNAPDVDTDAANHDGVAVAARDVSGFGPSWTVLFDAGETTFPRDFARTARGDWRVQIVLDRNADYNYSGRGPGDIVSRAVTIHFPLTSPPAIALDHVVPPAAGQFDTTGMSPGGAAQVLASRPHLHEELIASTLLTRFRGTPQTIPVWVLTPPAYEPKSSTTYPTVYVTNGFGATHKDDGQLLSRICKLMAEGSIPPMIWATPAFASPSGTTEFADSVNNGPWGQALAQEVIPALEARYRMDPRPSGRFLTGHSSGGWFALWTIVQHPKLFGGSWPTSPDPVDFRSFLGVDLYAPDANLYRDGAGRPRPEERDGGRVLTSIETEARMETVLGRVGGQLQSFDWVFSPRRADGTPAPMFDRDNGAVDPAIAAYWRDHYDIGHLIETQWPRLRHDLDGKVHLSVGTADSFYLDGAVHQLEAAFHKVGAHADFTYVPGATHGISSLYARNGDRAALYKDMAWAMYKIARPHSSLKRSN